MKTDLSQFSNAWYSPGKGKFVLALWYIINALIFKTGLFPFSRLKVGLLRWFGAKVGEGVVLKPHVNVKYPWRLEIGNYCWIGEQVWIDNLGNVKLGNHVCLSQGAMLLCGNHDYKKPAFDLIVGDITLEDGVWIGARSMVGPGVSVGNHAILSIGSYATTDVEPYGIYRGNPAVKIKERVILPS